MQSNSENSRFEPSSDEATSVQIHLNRIEPGLKQTSVASTISFLFGVCALATLVLVRPSLILSLPAILFGHVAKANLRRANGELVGWGKARIGKLLGYACFVASSLALFYLDDYRLLVRGAMESERTAVVNAHDRFSPGQLGAIEKQLAAGDKTEFGNDENAARLAAAFRSGLRESLNSVLTHRNQRGLGLDTSGVSCYCYIGQSIVFIAAIPELNGYNGAAEEVLQKAAWQSAILAVQETQAENLNSGVEIAVGLMGRGATEVVMLGSPDSRSDGVPAPTRLEGSAHALVLLINR